MNSEYASAYTSTYTNANLENSFTPDVDFRLFSSFNPLSTGLFLYSKILTI